MTKGSIFDDMTRVLGSGMPRRRALRLVVAGLAGNSIAAFVPRPAGAKGQLCYTTRRVLCVDRGCKAIEGGDCTYDGSSCECFVPGGTLCYVGFLNFCYDNGCSAQRGGVCKGENLGGPPCYCVVGSCPQKTVHHVTAVNIGPPTQLTVSFRNAVDGINAIEPVVLQNCSVTGVPFTGNAVKTAVDATLTKTDPSKPASFHFNVTDGAGTTCGMDPIFTVLKLSTGQWARQTFSKIPYAERFIAITNGRQGLTGLHVWANGAHVRSLALRDAETQTIDLSAVLAANDNTLSFVGVGEIGASAAIAIMDTPLQPQADAAAAAGPPELQIAATRHRHNVIWGPLEEEIQENSRLHGGSVASQTLAINFNGAIDATAASRAGLYTVVINGRTAPVSTAYADRDQNGVTVTLSLAPGTLRAGDIADIDWDHLLDAKGRTLWGHVSVKVGP